MRRRRAVARRCSGHSVEVTAMLFLPQHVHDVVPHGPAASVSELELRVDGVGATSRHRDAVVAAVKQSTCLAR